MKRHEAKLMGAKMELCSELAMMKVRAGRLGLFKTMHALDAATKAVGFEVAEHIESAKGIAVEDRRRRGERRVTTPQAAGGHARAEKLTPARRSEIARKAAEARWSRS